MRADNRTPKRLPLEYNNYNTLFNFFLLIGLVEISDTFKQLLYLYIIKKRECKVSREYNVSLSLLFQIFYDTFISLFMYFLL